MFGCLLSVLHRVVKGTADSKTCVDSFSIESLHGLPSRFQEQFRHHRSFVIARMQFYMDLDPTLTAKVSAYILLLQSHDTHLYFLAVLKIAVMMMMMMMVVVVVMVMVIKPLRIQYLLTLRHYCLQFHPLILLQW